MKTINIIGGGTVSYIRNHLALCAPAYGSTAKKLEKLCRQKNSRANNKAYGIYCHLTKMADSTSDLETNEDISNLLDKLIANPDTKIIFFNPALVDFNGSIAPEKEWNVDWETGSISGKYESRLKTSEGSQLMLLTPAEKLVSKIRKQRKDIFLVAFKTTCGATADEQFLTGLHLLKSSSCNLVVANDTKTRLNMIITPEQARYSVTTNRDEMLSELVDMTLARANLTFTKSTVVEGDTVSWSAKAVPDSLRTVVDHCITKGAYKPFNGSTVGHFAVKIDDNIFLTSKRKTNFNNLNKVGLVKVESSGPDEVVAYGSKPSVGGQSQRIVFKDHPEMDCIVHFHCPQKGLDVPVRPQKFFECGSHECGENTSKGLAEVVSGIKCVYLDNHGPNIVFNRNIDPQKVINFIEENFDLSQATDEINRNNL
jgi:hypothetical protein